MTCLCESRMRENCTSGLSGGRGPALRRAPSDPTPWKPGNAGGGKEPHFGRVVGKDNGHGDWLRPRNPNNAQASRKATLLRAKIVTPCREHDRVPLVKPVGEPDAGNPHVRFDERGVETEHGRRLLRHNRGNLDTEVNRSLNHRATPRLYRPHTSPKRKRGRHNNLPSLALRASVMHSAPKHAGRE